MKLSLIPLIAGLAAGLLMFQVARVMTEGPREKPPALPAKIAAPIPPENIRPALPAVEPPAVEDAMPAEKAKELPPPAAPIRPTVLAKWTLPGEPTGHVDRYSNIRARTITMNSAGTRVVTVSETEAHCWDTATGRRLQTIPHDKNHRLFASPDGRVVASVANDGSEVTLLAAETGQRVGSYQAGKRHSVWIESNRPAFTPSGDHLLLLTKNGNRYVFQAISTRTGAAEALDIPDWEKSHRLYDALLPVPRKPVIIVALGGHGIKKTPSGVVALDVRNETERPVTGLDVRPRVLFDDIGIRLSADGKYVLAREQKRLQVCDWYTDQLLLDVAGADHSGHLAAIDNAWFTPDAQRCLVLRVPHYYIFTAKGRENPPVRVELYDIARKKVVGEFACIEYDLDGVSALAVSPDGKAVVVADRKATVKVLDFERVFHVAPLPPVPQWGDIGGLMK